IPQDPVAGDWAVTAGESDLAAAKSVGGLFLSNGPEFERSPREFVAAVRRVREILGPAKVLAVTGLATPSNLSVLVYAGIDVVGGFGNGMPSRLRLRCSCCSHAPPASRIRRAVATADFAMRSWRVRIRPPSTRSSSHRLSALFPASSSGSIPPERTTFR